MFVSVCGGLFLFTAGWVGCGVYESVGVGWFGATWFFLWCHVGTVVSWVFFFSTCVELLRWVCYGVGVRLVVVLYGGLVVLRVWSLF